MQKKQTAVQWLLEQLERNLAIGYNSITKQQHEKSLAMEREQIEEAYENGTNDENAHIFNHKEVPSGEQYYTKTYSEPTKN